MPSLQQVLTLPSGNQTGRDELLSHELGIVDRLIPRLLLQFEQDPVERITLDQLAAADQVQKLIDFEFRHSR